MTIDHETVIHVTPDAAWLPRHGRAEVIRRSTPPGPMSVVRLLLRQDDRVLCVPRHEDGRLDLPHRIVGADDPCGEIAIADLADQVIGCRLPLTFTGAVRNVVDTPHDDYPWPTPHAHFGIWASESAPVVQGVWISIRGESPLRERHWFPLMS
ncbi:NUDIX hydrolase [Microbacterium sp. WCS2018Hpa-23]|uniref:NUDIX hydrolase n=1 Tax=Microbacterium sp. WCS2018Hpa-23 TaxID=3073634 RepID=UPI002882EEE5|nr:NUDIX hydrolase [Microbacterium sp. WCS2018Hpa-23]